LIVSGRVALSLSAQLDDAGHYWEPGELMGIVTLRSGLPFAIYALAAEDTVILETPVKTAGKLFNSVTSIKQAVERAFLRRLIFRTFISIIPREEILEEIKEADFVSVMDQGEILRVKPNQPVYAEGDATDAFFIILKGSVSLSRKQDGKDQIQHLVTAGNWFGIDEIYLGGNRLDTATASTATEILKLNSRLFFETISRFPSIQQGAERKARKMLLKEHQRSNEESTNAIIGFVEKTGVVEGSNVLVIDEALCVRCDNCEKACAETHGGVSRLKRKAGETFATIHVPTACRHCYEPGCMKDCPANCISRQPGGQVLIDTNVCIGCGNCSSNCPFGVIQMIAPEPQQPLNLWAWLFWGNGRAPGQETEHVHGPGTVVKKAMKCDLCHGQSSGPACVQACPTGAAIRSAPDVLVSIFEESKLK
jgi:Fe-S-cluster-containing hydrogenase component 2/CRP-like cAMP-binding protein